MGVFKVWEGGGGGGEWWRVWGGEWHTHVFDLELDGDIWVQ